LISSIIWRAFFCIKFCKSHGASS